MKETPNERSLKKFHFYVPKRPLSDNKVSKNSQLHKQIASPEYKFNYKRAKFVQCEHGIRALTANKQNETKAK